MIAKRASLLHEAPGGTTISIQIEPVQDRAEQGDSPGLLDKGLDLRREFELMPMESPFCAQPRAWRDGFTQRARPFLIDNARISTIIYVGMRFPCLLLAAN